MPSSVEIAPDVEALRLTIVERLPVRSRWLLAGASLDWDFSRAAQPLQSLSDADAEKWKEVLPSDWRELFIFGEESYAEGGGAAPLLCVHAETGEVIGLDAERESSSTYLVNSTVPAFIETFLLLDEALRPGAVVPAGLKERIYEADPSGFDGSDWRDLVDFLSQR